MGRVLYEDTLKNEPANILAAETKPYSEPSTVQIAEDWDTMIEDFIEDFDDYQDLNFPGSDDDL